MLLSEVLMEIKFLLKYRISGELLYRRHQNTLQTFCISLCYGDRLNYIYSQLLGLHPSILQMHLSYFNQKALKKEDLAYLCSYALWCQNPNRGLLLNPIDQSKFLPYNGGKVSKLQVLLDTCGYVALESMYLHHQALTIWLKQACLPVKIIYTVANPFDFLANLYYDQYPELNTSSQETYTMDFLIESYFNAYCRSIDCILLEYSHNILVLHSKDIREDLIGAVEQGLDFLQLERDEAYLRACGRVKLEASELATPRSKYPWTPEQISQVEAMIQTKEYLKSFSFIS